MKPQPDAIVAAWLDHQPAESIWTTTVTVFEVKFGLHRLPHGKRRARLEELFQSMLAEDIADRVLPFDTLAAEAAAALSAKLHEQGKPVEIRDVQIAGIARARNAIVATGNVKHFERMCEVRDPWEDAS